MVLVYLPTKLGDFVRANVGHVDAARDGGPGGPSSDFLQIGNPLPTSDSLNGNIDVPSGKR